MSAKNVRLFIDSSLAFGQTLTLDQQQSHYLLKVLRVREGEVLRGFNGRDGEWQVKIKLPSKKVCELEIVDQLRSQNYSPYRALLIPPLKPARLEIAVEKATELGTTDIHFVKTRYSGVKLPAMDRLNRIALEASEQSERLDLPTLHPLQPLADVLKDWNTSHPILTGIERGKVLPMSDPLKACAVLVGPEGGWSSEELQLFDEVSFIKKVSLGQTILRAETAAVVLMGLIHVEGKL